MSARLAIGDERYTVTDGQVVPLEPTDPVQLARASYLNSVGPVWVAEARHDGRLSYYDPDQDCTLAQVIAEGLKGRADCAPMPAATTGDLVF